MLQLLTCAMPTMIDNKTLVLNAEIQMSYDGHMTQTMTVPHCLTRGVCSEGYIVM